MFLKTTSSFRCKDARAVFDKTVIQGGGILCAPERCMCLGSFFLVLLAQDKGHDTGMYFDIHDRDISPVV